MLRVANVDVGVDTEPAAAAGIDETTDKKDHERSPPENSHYVFDDLSPPLTPPSLSLSHILSLSFSLPQNMKLSSSLPGGILEL